MPRLKINEVQTISNILLDLYSIDDVEELERSFITDIRTLVPYDQGSFQTLDQNSEEMLVSDTVFVNVKEELAYLFDNIKSENDYLKHLFYYKNSIVYVETDLLSDDVRKNTEFYKVFFEPQSLEYSAGIILIKDRNNLGVVSLFRSKDWGDFNEKEVFILDIFKSHLANMIKNCLSVSDKRIDLDDEMLTAREKEIMNLLVKGYTNEEIANMLYITVSTTKKHVYNIFNKYGVNSRMALIKTLHSK